MQLVVSDPGLSSPALQVTLLFSFQGNKPSMSRITDVAVAFTIVILLVSYTEARRRRVDCTKFVFAPVCRGIAAKRDDMHIYSSHTLENPARKHSRTLPLVNKDYNFGSTSLKDSMLLSKLLMVLSQTDPERSLAGRDIDFRSSTDQGPALKADSGEPSSSVARWLED